MILTFHVFFSINQRAIYFWKISGDNECMSENSFIYLINE